MLMEIFFFKIEKNPMDDRRRIFHENKMTREKCQIADAPALEIFTSRTTLYAVSRRSQRGICLINSLINYTGDKVDSWPFVSPASHCGINFGD